jgi:hypothetical protein
VRERLRLGVVLIFYGEGCAKLAGAAGSCQPAQLFQLAEGRKIGAGVASSSSSSAPSLSLVPAGAVGVVVVVVAAVVAAAAAIILMGLRTALRDVTNACSLRRQGKGWRTAAQTASMWRWPQHQSAVELFETRAAG